MLFKNKSFLFIFLTFLCYTSYAQDTSQYWIQFKYKANTQHSLLQPEQYLSPKSIDRRLKFNIALDSTDLPVNPNYISTISALGLTPIKKSKWLNGIVVETADTNLLQTISGLAFVSSIKRIAPKRGLRLYGNATYDAIDISAWFNVDIGTPLPYGYTQNQIEQIKLDCLHAEGFTGKGMTIAVLDAGFYNVDELEAFQKLFNDGRLLGTYDFVDMDAMLYDNTSSHGTMVLSCMAAWLPKVFIGTAPDASYYLFRTEDNKSENIIEEYNWAAAAEWADSVGVDMINSSLGYTTFNDPTMNYTYASMNGNTSVSTIAADWAAHKGLLVSNSAGNSGNGTWHYIGAPSDGDSVLAVGAVDSTGLMANFSSYGPSADGQIKPNSCAKGLDAIVVNTDGNIVNANGTSFASPILCGAVACLWQALPKFNNYQIIQIVQEYSNRYNNPSDQTGYGLADLCSAYWKNSVMDFDVVNNYEVPYLYPNPSSDKFYLFYKSLSDKSFDLQFYDENGKYLANNTYELRADMYYNIHLKPLDNVSSGVYFIKIVTNKDTVTLKALKN